MVIIMGVRTSLGNPLKTVFHTDSNELLCVSMVARVHFGEFYSGAWVFCIPTLPMPLFDYCLLEQLLAGPLGRG